MAILPLSDVDIAIKLASLAISMHLILIPFSDVLHLFCYEQAKAMLLIKPPPALIVLLVALKHTIAMCEVIIPRPLIKVSIRIEKLSSSLSLSIAPCACIRPLVSPKMAALSMSEATFPLAHVDRPRRVNILLFRVNSFFDGLVELTTGEVQRFFLVLRLGCLSRLHFAEQALDFDDGVVVDFCKVFERLVLERSEVTHLGGVRICKFGATIFL